MIAYAIAGGVAGYALGNTVGKVVFEGLLNRKPLEMATDIFVWAVETAVNIVRKVIPELLKLAVEIIVALVGAVLDAIISAFNPFSWFSGSTPQERVEAVNGAGAFIHSSLKGDITMWEFTYLTYEAEGLPLGKAYAFARSMPSFPNMYQSSYEAFERDFLLWLEQTQASDPARLEYLIAP